MQCLDLEDVEKKEEEEGEEEDEERGRRDSTRGMSGRNTL